MPRYSGAATFDKKKRQKRGVGKRKRLPENATPISFKTRSIVVPSQLEGTQEPTTKRKLSLPVRSIAGVPACSEIVCSFLHVWCSTCGVFSMWISYPSIFFLSRPYLLNSTITRSRWGMMLWLGWGTSFKITQTLSFPTWAGCWRVVWPLWWTPMLPFDMLSLSCWNSSSQTLRRNIFSHSLRR